MTSSGLKTLGQGQKLIEEWAFEFEAMPPAHRGPNRVRGRMVWWPHSTHYASSVTAPDINTARLEIVLNLARAICNDPMAFKYDEDNIHNANMLRWFRSKMEELEAEFDAETITPKDGKRLRRAIEFLEGLQAQWQEDHDYWPEEQDDKQHEAMEEERALIKDRPISHQKTDDRQAARQAGPQAPAPDGAPGADEKASA